MNRNEFFQSMTDFASTYGDAVMAEMAKANCKYNGLYLKREGINSSPVVNLDYAYEMYRDDKWTLDDCYNYIDGVFATEMPNIDIDDILNWDSAKQYLCTHLYGNVNEGVVSRKVEDMYLVPYLRLTDDGTMGTKVTTELMQLWGVSEDEVFLTASENQESICPLEINCLFSNADASMYIVTNSDHHRGASAMFYSGAFEKIRAVIGGDFYILPSSIDEVIVLPKDDDFDVSDLSMMVSASLAEEDRLTNSVYTYDFDNQQFKKVA